MDMTTTQPIKHGHPVLIIGAGRGGSALLELFIEERLVEVIAIVDPNPEAPGIKLARKHGIPTYGNAHEALNACRDYPQCIVYNLTHDDSIVDEVARVFGDKKVTGGVEAMLFWQMVTNLRKTQNELERNQRQLQAVIHNAMDGIITIGESGEILAFNPAAEEIFGYTLHEVLGKSVNMLMPPEMGSEHDTYIGRYLETGEEKILGMRGREVEAVRKTGERFPLELSASEMVLGGQRYFIGIVRDITERKQTEQKIAYLAHHDYLTGLPNRALFLDRLGQSLSLANRTQYKEALLFLDLDGFKGINDTLGHDIGDLLLKHVAARLTKIIRASDTLARLGGDEFVMVLNNIKTKENASLVAQKIIAALSRPMELNGHSCRIGCSVGIAMFPDDSDKAEALIKQADEAMYLSKQRGKNTYTFHSAVAEKAPLADC